MGGLGREGAPGAGAGAGLPRSARHFICAGVGMLLRTPGVTRQFPNSVLSGSFPHPCSSFGVVSYFSVKGRFELRVQLNPKGSQKGFKALVWEFLRS